MSKVDTEYFKKRWGKSRKKAKSKCFSCRLFRTEVRVFRSEASGWHSSSRSRWSGGTAGRSWRRTRPWTSGSTGRPSRWSLRKSGTGWWQIHGSLFMTFYIREKKHFVLGVLLSDKLIKMSLPLRTENLYRSRIFFVINWFLIFCRNLQFSGEVVPDKMTIYIQ